MPFCFLEYRPASDREGRTPDCPEEIGFLLLADHPGLQWGIFHVERSEEWSPPDPVGEDLERLIVSGKRYPPALALARYEVRQVFGDHCPSLEDFARAYGVALRHHLSQQPESPYVLAQALKDEVGYLDEGEWYWVLRVSGSPPVASWVSGDFHVYNNDMSDFDLTGQQLKQLGYSG
jgi:hypothetical protein